MDRRVEPRAFWASREHQRRRWLPLGAKGAVSALLLWILLQRIDLGQMLSTLAGVRLEFFTIALILYIGGQLLSAFRWKILTTPIGISASYGQLVALYFLGMFFNFFLPTVIGGDAVKAYYLARETRDSVRALASVFMDRNTGLGALLLVALVAAAVGRVEFADRPLVILLLGGLLLYVILNLVLFADVSYRFLNRFFSAVRWMPLVVLVDRAHVALRAYRSAPLTLGKAVGVSLVFHLMLIGLNYANARALGLALDFLAFCVFIPIISLLSMLPITMYGLGVREYAFVLFFSSLGVTREASLLLALLWFAVVVLASLPGAMVYIAYGRRSLAESHSRS
ncbi:MAG: flippase-like domain-containing protein [Blastocatellia bacterium]|nr:flippase-like domain-containing protein [Blastocatellia bacterium]MCX7753475.1 flippase-like domain-containing protein [Blastocatellia bacterium]MDW8167866.1 lysylphosphatidylglycerol synthase transmembrane domain-containing protein [Acidobacteriota bacterium]